MRKSRKKKSKLRPLLAALWLAVFALVLLSVWKISSIVGEYRSAERRYDSLAGSVVAAPPLSDEETPPPSPSAALEEEGEAIPVPEESAPPRELSPLSVDFDALRRLSGDVIGWLSLPDTVVNYPVMQGRDNKYYLERFLDGSVAAGGSLFADCGCPSDFSGRNTVIYGHNMRDGSMFALIDDYADQRFYEEHPVMYLNTPGQNYRIDFFSGFTVDPEAFVYTTAFSSDEDFAAFLGRLLSASVIDCPVEVGVGDRIVTLSTCTYSDLDVRFVLCGKLTEIG